jgi:hypothetical protein
MSIQTCGCAKAGVAAPHPNIKAANSVLNRIPVIAQGFDAPGMMGHCGKKVKARLSL